MDCYKCEICGTVEDEFEFNFKFASDSGHAYCEKCIEQARKDCRQVGRFRGFMRLEDNTHDPIPDRP